MLQVGLQFILIFLASLYLLSNCSNDNNDIEQKSLTLCFKDPGCFELTNLNFNEKWESLQQELQTVSVLRIYECALSESNYKRILDHQMPFLKILDFHYNAPDHVRKWHQQENALTVPLVEAILNSKYISQLLQLDLSNTKISFKHFKILQAEGKEPIKVHLKKLSLKNNFLEKKGFQLIGKIKFENILNQLELDGNSLIDQSSIQSLKKILKPSKSESESKAQILKKLSIYDTSITSANLRELLEHIETENLEHLDIGKNPLQHSKQYAIPFNYSIYEYISAINLSSLKTLSMRELDLDQEQLQYFCNWKLPAVSHLDLGGNFISDNYFKYFITREQIPSLEKLNIERNNITDRGIKYLARQKFQSLNSLNVSSNKGFSLKYLKSLKMLNFSNFKQLDFSDNLVVSQSIFNDFFKGQTFPNLQVFRMQKILAAQQFMNLIKWKQMKKLRVLDLYQSDIYTSVNIFWRKQKPPNINVLFPSLEKLYIGGFYWLNQISTILMINNIGKICPKLKLLSIKSNTKKKDCLLIDKIDPSSISQNLYIETNSVKIRKYSNPDKTGPELQLVEMSLLFKQNFPSSFAEKYKTEYLVESLNIFTKQFNVLDPANSSLSQFVSIQPLQKITTKECENQIQNYCPFGLLQKNSSSIEQSNQANQTQQADNIENKSSILFPYLTELQIFSTNWYQRDLKAINLQFGFLLSLIKLPKSDAVKKKGLDYTSNVLQLIKTLKMPLKKLKLNGELSQQMKQPLARVIQTSDQLISLQILNSSLDCSYLDLLLANSSLPFLRALLIQSSNLSIRCLFNMNFSILEKNSLIDTIKISNRSSLDSLSQKKQNQNFQNIFSKMNHLFLISLDLVLINLQHLIQNVNTQFLQRLSLKNFQIYSSTLQKQNALKQDKKMFPKLTFLQLRSLIQQSGQPLVRRLNSIANLLNSGMPYLNKLELNNNTKIFNFFLRFPMRLTELKHIDSYLKYSIEKDFNPKSTRYLREIKILSKDWAQADYANLFKCDFPNLLYVSLRLNEVTDCQILESILRITKRARAIKIHIDNKLIKNEYLNDSCLQRRVINSVKSNSLLATTLNTTKAVHPMGFVANLIMFEFTSEGNMYLPFFLQYFYTSHRVTPLEYINLNDKYFTDEMIDQILDNNNLYHLRNVQLRGNLIQSSTLHKIFNGNCPFLEVLNLAHNKITSFPFVIQSSNNTTSDQAVKSHSKVFLPSLKQLDLSKNPIGQKELYILSQQKQLVSQLSRLSLINVDMTIAALERIIMTIVLNKKPIFGINLMLRIENNPITEDQFIKIIKNFTNTIKNMKTKKTSNQSNFKTKYPYFGLKVLTSLEIEERKFVLIKEDLQLLDKMGIKFKQALYKVHSKNQAYVSQQKN